MKLSSFLFFNAVVALAFGICLVIMPMTVGGCKAWQWGRNQTSWVNFLALSLLE